MQQVVVGGGGGGTCLHELRKYKTRIAVSSAETFAKS